MDKYVELCDLHYYTFNIVSQLKPTLSIVKKKHLRYLNELQNKHHFNAHI